MNDNISTSYEEIKNKLKKDHFSVFLELAELYKHKIGEKESPLSYVAPGITINNGEITGLAICNIDHLPINVFNLTSLREMDIAIDS